MCATEPSADARATVALIWIARAMAALSAHVASLIIAGSVTSTAFPEFVRYSIDFLNLSCGTHLVRKIVRRVLRIRRVAYDARAAGDALLDAQVALKVMA